MMTEEKYLKSVMDELEHIKKNATQQEINNLDINIFQATNRSTCIYGQMTGDCFSDRAKELCPKTVSNLAYHDDELSQCIDHILDEGYYNNYFTPLEAYLPLRRANPKEIIEYLKGERDTISI